MSFSECMNILKTLSVTKISHNLNFSVYIFNACVTNRMPNALEMNLKAFTRKEHPITADINKTLTEIERNMIKL